MELLQRTTSLPAGGGQWNSCNARAHQLGGQGFPPRRRSLPKERISCNTLPRCLGAVGSGTPTIHCLTTWGQLGNPFPEYTASRPRGSGEWNSYNAMPHCLRGGGQWKSCNARAHQLWGHKVLPRRGSMRKERNSCNAMPQCPRQWAVQLMQHAASLPWSCGQWNSRNTRPHCSKQWAVELLQCTVSLLGGSGQCNSCNALPHRLGQAGS